MSLLKLNLIYFISNKNTITRLFAFGILAPLTLYLIQPKTLPDDQWPYLLTFFWGFCFVSITPLLFTISSVKVQNQIEYILTDFECMVAGVWASTFGLDVLTIWAILTAGVFNQVGFHGFYGFFRVIIFGTLGFGLGSFWFEIPLEPKMNIEVALVMLPCFLIFLTVAEIKRRQVIDELAQAKEIMEQKALHISELNKEIQFNADREKQELLARLDLTRSLGDGLAHDLNNMLTIVLGAAELIESDQDQESRQSILDGTLTATRLVQRFRQHHREEIEYLDLKPIIHSLMRSVRCLAPAILIKFDIKTSTVIYVSRLELEQVIMNLCLNAIHAMENQGELHLEINDHSESHKEVIVRDTGKGIQTEDLPYIFDAFFTTKQHQGGTGVGLANVKQLVERWGGTITVQSTVGLGTQFSITIPTAPPKNTANTQLDPQL